MNSKWKSRLKLLVVGIMIGVVMRCDLYLGFISAIILFGFWLFYQYGYHRGSVDMQTSFSESIKELEKKFEDNQDKM